MSTTLVAIAFRAHLEAMAVWEQDRLAHARSNARDICALRTSAKTMPALFAVILSQSQRHRACVDHLAEAFQITRSILQYYRDTHPDAWHPKEDAAEAEDLA